MRKSRNKSGFRPVRAGVAVAATAVAVVAGTAVPAQAAAVTLSSTQIPAAGGVPFYFYGASGAVLNSKGVRFVTPTSLTCPAAYDTVSADSVNGGVITGAVSGDGYLGRIILPSTFTAGTSYKTCFYADATTGAAYATDTIASPNVTAVQSGPLSATSGAANSRTNLTVAAANFSSTGTFTTQFVSGVTACPTTFVTPDATHLNATTARSSATALAITVPTGLTAGTPYFVCTYSGTVNNTSPLVARGTTTFATYAAMEAATVDPTGGSSGTATNVTLNIPSGSAIFTGAAPQALLTRNSCPTTRPAVGVPNSVSGLETFLATTTKISATKLAVAVPTAVVVNTGDVATPWNVCTYATNTAGSAMLTAPVTYNAAPALTLTSANFAVGTSAAATTASGPAAGGSTVTVTGLTGVPTQPQVDAGAVFSASLGGSPIRITAIHDATSFTGVTSSHTPGAVRLAVTTAAGTMYDSTADYTYDYGISVTPNTGISGSTQVLDITGAGFSNITTWNETATGVVAAAGAYVVLAGNTYANQVFNSSNVFGTAPVSYCNGVLPISDKELICTLNLTAAIDSVATNIPTITGVDVPAGTYTVQIINDATDIDPGEASIVSSGSTFTVAPF